LIPNPYYIAELRPLSGLDKKIQDFLLSSEETNKFISNCIVFLDYIIPVYISSGRPVSIAIGCTGGRHRSVTFVEWLYSYYKNKMQSLLKEDPLYELALSHRDISNEGNK